VKRALILLFFALPLLAAEPWVDAYNRGVAAVNSSSYKTAANELQKAINEMPTEGTSVRTRSAFITYVPHFWLGIAKYNLGDFDGALREWRTSDEQGAIAKTEYYATMKNWVSRAQAEKKRLAQGAASGAKKNASDAISGAVLAQADALSANGDRADSYRTALRMLQDANAKYNRGGTDIDSYNDAAQLATKATSLFNAAADEARRQRAARAAAPKPQPKPQQQQPVEVVVPIDDVPKQQQPKVEPKVVESPKPEPPKPVVEKPSEQVITKSQEEASTALQRYRRNLGIAKSNPKLQTYVRTATGDADKLRKKLDTAKSDADFQAITQIATTLEQALAKQVADSKSGGQTIQPVPSTGRIASPPLHDAYRAFAMGDLASSEQLLTKILTTGPNAEAFLLRGCARYTRAMLSRKPDELLSAATADFKAALQRNRSLRLDTRAFSPKLISYFENVRNGRP
jgi:tetratricopeptide (TPR) repeat protein